MILNSRNKRSESRVLVISDLHEPFTLDGYMQFCVDISEKYKCNEVVFIGDILDNHYSSYHETDPDGYSARDELERAKKKIRLWYEVFPSAKVCLGNHDLIPDRKRFTAGLSSAWVRNVGEVINTPNWEFNTSFKIDEVKYIHGTGMKARNRAKKELHSIVQGHYHSESYVEYFVGSKFKIFAMQVGAGIDKNSYAMAYGKDMPKPHINCGVVIGGELGILEYMQL